MLFDKERNIIRITLGELVSIARRGISPTLPFDEEEPNLLEVTSRRLRAILGEVRSEKLLLSCSEGTSRARGIAQSLRDYYLPMSMGKSRPMNHRAI